MKPLPTQPISNGIPVHVAIIMDGNGRWAKARGLPRAAGHAQGAEAVRRTVKAASELGIRYLTLYGFSLENWKRPAKEIADLMGLLRLYLRKEIGELHREGVRIRFIGDRRRVAAGELTPDSIDEEMLQGRLYTADMPDPDLIVRTSGEQRISNFLLWQSAYAEFVFTDVLWPDFSREKLEDSIEEFSRRERRYGATTA